MVMTAAIIERRAVVAIFIARPRQIADADQGRASRPRRARQFQICAVLMQRDGSGPISRARLSLRIQDVIGAEPVGRQVFSQTM